MKQLTINPSNKRFYSEEFIKGFECGTQRQLEADKKSRPQGEWIRINSLYSIDKTYRCSVCGKVIYDMPMDEYYDPAYKGCPYCLTRMKGADDE